jgi:hypothetical protein
MADPHTIQQLREEIFRKAVEAAQKKQTDRIAMLASLARECEAVLETMKSLDDNVKRIKTELENRENIDAVPSVSNSASLRFTAGASRNHSRKAGGRERGRENREKWVIDAQRNLGVRLRRLGEVTYQTASGKTVGMPYASEAPQRTYPWWLGLPDEQPYYVVLLCETTEGKLFGFVLDHHCVSQIWGSLSRDDNHHVKFHVKRSGPNWELKLKDGPIIPLNEFHNSGAGRILQ